jgi:two-component sensor histidine kinase
MIRLAVITLMLSVVFQLSALISALRLIKLTGKSGSWLLISGALLLMSLRRILPLYDILANKVPVNLPNEIIGLLLSIMMFAGILGIKSIFLERHRAEAKVRSMLAEKDMILKEVHHRIKNNMNTLISLLNLQAGTLSDKNAIAALEEAGSRVRSMMLLYDQLAHSANFMETPVQKYLSTVVDKIAATFTDSGHITLEKHLDDFVMDSRRLQTLGIIINELLTNSMKYAFVGRTTGTLRIFATLLGDRVQVRVQDDGIGIPETVDLKQSSGLGLQLVHALAEQLDGTVSIERKGGTTVTLEFAK